MVMTSRSVIFAVRLISFSDPPCRPTAARLRMLGHAEVRQVVAERGRVEVNCEFCNRRYAFDRVDAEQLFASEVLTRAESTRH